ncbi:MAG: hypothetical protein ACYDDI_08815 [Candidatus Acidiferrales bacterium]
MSLRKFAWLLMFSSLAFTFVGARPAVGHPKKTNCGNPPEIVRPPKPPKKEKQKQPKVKVQGTVAIEISESGEVVSATPLHPSSREAAAQLVSLAKSMKFKPRPGCSVFKTIVNYNIGR